MDRRQRKALQTLVGKENAAVIEAWCRAEQNGDVIRWIKKILMEEIAECWNGNIEECLGGDFRDKLILDQFQRIGLFREKQVSEIPTVCPCCKGQVVPTQQVYCSIWQEPRQEFECSDCDWQDSIYVSWLATHPEVEVR